MDASPLDEAAVRPPAVISRALPTRELVLAGGRVHLDTAAYPALVVGSAPAREIIAVMFDYTCEACRANHAWLTGAILRRPAGLTVLVVPTPLDPACNPAVERLRPEHANACLYARYALAVWKAAPEQFAAYDAWLMGAGGTLPPPIEEARRQAEAIVGAAAFGQALGTPEIERSLQTAGRMYQRLEAGVIPKLLLPGEVLVENFSSAEEFNKALDVRLEGNASNAW